MIDKAQMEVSPIMRDHAATLTIDLSALQANWRLLAGRADAAECGAAVKADAYGLGIETAVPALVKAGCRTFFVAHLSEGKRVRALAPEARIYVLNGLPLQAAADYAKYRLCPVIGTLEEARFWTGFRDGNAEAPPAALHVETGMNRLGLTALTIKTILYEGLIAQLGLDLVMSHFIASEEPKSPHNARQIAMFSALAKAIQAADSLNHKAERRQSQLQLSLANSSGLFLAEAPFFDLVRPGYALYGGNPTPGKRNPMQPVIKLEAPIMQVRSVKAGESVGYNATWLAERESRIALLSCGYADGYPRSASSEPEGFGGVAIINGRECPIAGRVSMDLITIDVTDLPPGGAHVGDAAILIGGALDIDRVGRNAGRIGYEILTGLGHRYHRKPIENGKPVASTN